MADPFSWAGLAAVVGAIGGGVQYAATRSAASTQDTMALLNAQAQTQSVTQAGQINSLQASINKALATKDQEAADAQAKGLTAQAELNSAAARAATRKNREEMAKITGAQRAAAASRGVVDTTGSTLALLEDTARKDQEAADLIRTEDENSRRALFREAVSARNQGIIAGIQGTGYQASGIAATQLAITQAAQAKLDMYSQRASASAMRTQGLGNLISSAGNIGMDYYKTYKAMPRKASGGESRGNWILIMAYPIASPIPSARPPETPRQAGGARGFRVDASDLASAQRAAIIPERGFIVQAGAAGAIGEAAQDISHGASQLMQEQFASTNRRKVMEADDMIQLAQDDLARRMEEEKDSSKLYGMAQQEVAKWEKELLGDQSLSIDARQAIESKVNRWKLLMLGDGKAVGSVQVHAAKREFKREADHDTSIMLTARKNGDTATADAQADKLHAAGHISETELVNQKNLNKEAGETQARRQQQSAVIASVNANGIDETIKTIEAEEGIDEVERDQLKSIAYREDRNNVSLAVKDVANYLAKTPGATAAEVETAAAGRLPPEELEKWKAEATERNKETVQTKRSQPKEIDANFARLLDEAEKFDRSAENAKEEYTRIHREAVTLLPIGLQGEITGPIEMKWRASQDLPEPPDALKSSINAIAGSMFEKGTLGKFMKDPVTVIKDGRMVTVIEKDFEKEQEALAKKGALLIYMGKWAAANPDKTPDEARKVMNQFLQGNAPVIRFTPPPVADGVPQRSQGTAPRNRTSTAMPDTVDIYRDRESGGGIENTLLPSLDYDPSNPLPQ